MGWVVRMKEERKIGKFYQRMGCGRGEEGSNIKKVK